MGSLGGLLRKAIQIRKKRSPRNLVDDESGITLEEQEQILSQIDEIIAQNRISIGSDTFNFKSKKSGLGLPVFINVFAVMIIVGGAFLLSVVFDKQEATIVTGSSNISTAESKVIETLKEESEQKLQAKEAEIDNIRTRLDQLNEERAALQAGFDEQISEKEAELRAQLETELEAERVRLQDQGISEEEIASRLNEMEAEKQQQFETELAALREDAEAELAEQEANMRVMEEQYRLSLETAEAERVDLEEELASREEELRAQYEAEQEAVQSEKTEIAAQLEQLQAQKQREALILDQVNSYYIRINEHISRAQFEEALAGLGTLESYFNQESISALPVIEQRKPADMLTIQSFRALLENRITGQDPGNREAEQALARISSAATYIEEAETQLEAGNIEEAGELYLQALNEIPVIAEGYEGLRQIESSAVTAELETRISELESQLQTSEARIEELTSQLNETESGLAAATAELDAAEEAIAAVEEELAVSEEELAAATAKLTATEKELATEREARERSREALEEREAIIADLRTTVNDYENRRINLKQRIETIQSEYLLSGTPDSAAEDPETASQAADDVSSQELANMLNTKITVKKVLDTDYVRSRYPTLYEDAEKYFQALERESREEGEQAALTDISELINALRTVSPGQDAAADSACLADLLEKYDSEREREILIQFLENVEKLIQ